MMVPEVATKRLELLKEALPGISGYLCCPDPAYLLHRYR